VRGIQVKYPRDIEVSTEAELLARLASDG
jgi:hypothetical protein